MNRVSFLLLCSLLGVSCHSPQPPAPSAAPASDSASTKSIFPVASVLQSEISGVDSGAYRIMVYRTVAGKTDSALVKPGRFDTLAAAFLLADLDSARMAARFTESSFMDATTGLLSFTYATSDTLFGLRRADVLAEPSLGQDKVRSIYLEYSSRHGDTLALRKMTWSTTGNFSILDILQPPAGATVTRQTRVVWNGE